LKIVSRFNLPWVAGVIDGGGRIEIRKDTNGMAGARVWLPAEMAEPVCSALEIPQPLGISGGRWTIPAEWQETVLRRVMPYMRNWDKINVAKTVVLFRVTQAGGLPGSRLSAGVRKLRRGLAGRGEVW
jgi:hypothetical protein